MLHVDGGTDMMSTTSTKKQCVLYDMFLLHQNSSAALYELFRPGNFAHYEENRRALRLVLSSGAKKGNAVVMGARRRV